MTIICVVLLLTGCGTNGTAPGLYRLDHSYPEPLETASSHPILVVEPVTVASYLDDSGIVYQSSAHRVVIAQNNRWASPLPGQLTEGLYAALAGSVTGVGVERANLHSSKIAFRLETEVDEFMGHYDGTAHIAGQWILFAPNGDRLGGNRFERQIPLARDGYDALVESLSRGWRQIANAIAPQIATTTGQRKSAETDS